MSNNNNSNLIKLDITVSSILLLLISGLLAQNILPLSRGNDSNDTSLEVTNKTPTQLIELRGFKAEEHKVVTEDGYILHLVRIVNPLAQSDMMKRPVLFNHGLFESATIWLINSNGVKPKRYPRLINNDDDASNTSFINAPMMLANQGYDVWLLSMRGTDFSQGHLSKSTKSSDYWDYCLDDFALRDIPATVSYIRKHTASYKIGYVGHSQATFSIFGLLSTRPEYAEIIEPVAAFAPVTFLHHTTSVGRGLFLLSSNLPILDHLNIPSPLFSPQIRGGVKNVCDKNKSLFLKSICYAEDQLISGMGQNFRQGFYSHLPFYSSQKVLRHFGQLIRSKRYAMYDYGKNDNMKHYNRPTNPDYEISRIKSRSIVLVWTKYDSLASPADVKKFVSKLKVPVFRSIYSDDKINHMDIIVSARASEFNKPLLEVFEHFENENRFNYPSYKQDLGSQEIESDKLFKNSEVEEEPNYNSLHWNGPGLSIHGKAN